MFKISLKIFIVTLTIGLISLLTVKASLAVTATPTPTPAESQQPFPQISTDYNLFPAPPGPISILLRDRKGPGYSLTLTKNGQTVSDYSPYKFKWNVIKPSVAIVTCAKSKSCNSRNVNIKPISRGSTDIQVTVSTNGQIVARGQLTVNVVTALATATPASSTPSGTISPTEPQTTGSLSPSTTPTPTGAPIGFPSFLFDLNMDGKVEELDLNILLNGFAKRQGD